MFDLTRRSRGWIWGCRLSALGLHWIYCSSLRLSDVDGGEAAGLPSRFLCFTAGCAGVLRPFPALTSLAEVILGHRLRGPNRPYAIRRWVADVVVVVAEQARPLAAALNHVAIDQYV